jgi:hemerythrin-like domain-containing protein
MIPDPVSAWRADHDYFRTLLRLLQREVDKLHAGARPNYELMLDAISYLHDFCDQVHHPREDVAFERLAKHRPELAPALARLRQEHRIIAQAGEALRGLLLAALDGSLVERASIEVAAATYLVYYGNHIQKEDEDVTDHAARALTEADWEAVRAAIPAQRDPLFGEVPEARFRALRRQIALEK